MKTTNLILAALLALSALPLAGAFASPIGTSTSATFCTGGAGPTEQCPWMLCWHPHYNQYGDASWCDIGLYYPCQYCVPLSADPKAPAPLLPAEVSSALLP